tara:strand:- start:27 stop:221 length:195 start_codon:yes stop_codon:yes gene_type:complete
VVVAVDQIVQVNLVELEVQVVVEMEEEDLLVELKQEKQVVLTQVVVVELVVEMVELVDKVVQES